jgi:hypothetical protein
MLSYDELLKAIPAVARPDAAKARNSHARVLKAREEMLVHSAEFKSLVRRLHHRHGVSSYKLAELLEISRSRVLVILQKK